MAVNVTGTHATGRILCISKDTATAIFKSVTKFTRRLLRATGLMVG